MVGAGTPIGTKEVQGYLWRVIWVDYTDCAIVSASSCTFQGGKNPIDWDLRSGYKLDHVVSAVLKSVKKWYGPVENYVEILKKNLAFLDDCDNSHLFINMGWGEFLPKGPEFKDTIDCPVGGFRMENIS